MRIRHLSLELDRQLACRLCVVVQSFFFFSSRRRHTRFDCDWSSDVCSSDLPFDLGAGKDGNAYLVDRDQMGQFTSSDNSQIVQTIPISPDGFFCPPAVWENNVYFAASGDVLKAFQLSGGLLSTTPTSQGSTVLSYPGATPVISADGSTNGIVWVLDNHDGGLAVLRAYDATDVSRELYNSTEAGDRDQAGPAVKFAVPTVADGKVYVGGQYQLTVFGLLQ